MDALSDSPWSRVQALGVRSASPMDLLALCLTREAKDASTNESAARDLLRRHRLSGLAMLSPVDLLAASGLDGFEADRILAAIELGRRSAGIAEDIPADVSGPKAAYQIVRPLLADQPQEIFVALLLTVKNTLIGVRTIHIGTLTAAMVASRDVLREALRANAASIIIAHNHPSGDPTPSREDVALTRKIKDAGAMLDIVLLDHIIVGSSGYISLMQESSR